MPDGYTVTNPEVFDMHFETMIDGKQAAHWTSKATITGSELIVNNTENYDVLDFPLDVFESYKKVVNAAADFNKIVVVLAKK
jgi:hypothetical protein